MVDPTLPATEATLPSNGSSRSSLSGHDSFVAPTSRSSNNNNNSINDDNNTNNNSSKRSDALSSAEEMRSVSPSTSAIAHLFSITPHDYAVLQDWAWKNRTVVAASSAAVCSVLSGFPFDSVKTRMQTHSYNSIMDCVRKTYAEERLGGFFRGMIPPLITVSIIKSISFSVYEGTKQKVRSTSSSLQGNTIPSLIGLTFISGSVAGTVVAMMSSPLELVKLQRQLEKLMAMHARKETEITASLTGDALLRQGLAGAADKKATSTTAVISSSPVSAAAMIKAERQSHGSITQYGIPAKAVESEAGASSWRTTKAIVKKKGWMGLYKGVNLHVMRDMLGTGIYFSSYETIKRLMSETIEHIKPHHHTASEAFSSGSDAGAGAGAGAGAMVMPQLKGPGPMVHFFAGGLCGVFSWLVVFPIDLVKSVVQKEVLISHPRYSGALECAKDIVRREGVRGLYRGLSVTCYRAMPIHSLNFLVYEAVMDHVKQWSGHGDDVMPAGAR